MCFATLNLVKKAIYKVPNGKLLKIFLEDMGSGQDRKINSIKITGDFFTYPEENIEKLEGILAGEMLDPDILKETIDIFLKNSGTEFFGIDSESIVQTILQAQ